MRTKKKDTHVKAPVNGPLLDSRLFVAQQIQEINESISHLIASMLLSLSSIETMMDETIQTDEATARLQFSADFMAEIIAVTNSIPGRLSIFAALVMADDGRLAGMGKEFLDIAREIKQLASNASKAAEEVVEQIPAARDLPVSLVERIENLKNAVEALCDRTQTASDIMRTERRRPLLTG